MAAATISVFLVLGLCSRLAHSSTALSLALFNDGTNCSSKAAQDNVWNPSPQDATSDGNNCVQSLPLVASSLTVIGIDAGCTGMCGPSPKRGDGPVGQADEARSIPSHTLLGSILQ